MASNKRAEHSEYNMTAILTKGKDGKQIRPSDSTLK